MAELTRRPGPPPLLYAVIALGVVMLTFAQAQDRSGLLPVAPRDDTPEDKTRSEVQALTTALESDFAGALQDAAKVPAFLAELTRHLQDAPSPDVFADHAANYTTKLLIARIQGGNHDVAEQVFRHYIDVLLPLTGLHEKSLDVASVSLAMPQRNAIFPDIERHILGENFDITTIEHPILLFNLACHYALNADKPRMLRATRLALERGKTPEEFLADADFDAYARDADFLTALDGSGSPDGPDGGPKGQTATDGTRGASPHGAAVDAGPDTGPRYSASQE